MASIKIKIRRKTLKSDVSDLFRQIFPIPSKKIKIHKDYGILTACSQKLFIGLQMLITSIVNFYDIHVLVYDVGMSSEQIAWCKKHPKVSVKPFKIPNYNKHITYAGAWFKSHYISSSPFKHTIWIDSDAIVIGDLRELIDLAHPNAFFTSDHTQLKESTLNQPKLYSYLPIGIPYYRDILPYLNSGVLITHKNRDADILEDWRYCVEQACSVKEIAEAVSCWDQGALKWSLHKNRKLYLITADKKFNYPAKIRHYAYPSTLESVTHWFNNMRPDEPCVILHWMGSPKPWSNWGDFIGLDI